MIRLVPDEPPEALSIDKAKETANRAYGDARAAQRQMVADVPLMWLMWRPGAVSYARLKGELHEARKQMDRARIVVEALEECVSALERGRR